MPSRDLYDRLTEEMLSIKNFHSVSPQFRFYSKEFNNRLDTLLYRGRIDKDQYKFLINGLYLRKDTNNIHTFIGIGEVLKMYKPRLNELDILYNANLGIIKVLKNLSEGICSSLGTLEVYVPPLQDRIGHIINYIKKCNDCVPKDNKEVYYYLSILKNALLIAGKVHPNQYMKDVCELYVEIYSSVIDKDREFYSLYERSYSDEILDNGTYLNSDEEVSNMSVFDKSNYFSKNSSTLYSYSDYLIDCCYVLSDLVSSSNNYPSIEEVNKKIFDSSIPSRLKNICSNDLYALRTSFLESRVNIVNPFYWYNEIQEDFIYHCTPLELEEGQQVAEAFCYVTKPENLIEFYINEASLISIANGGDKYAFNTSLKENLLKLYQHGMIEDYKEIYEQFRQ